MTELPLLATLICLAAISFFRPWVGTLGLVYLELFHPVIPFHPPSNKIGLYKILLGIVIAGAVWEHVKARRFPRIGWDWRMGCVAALLVQMLTSTWLSINPWLAWERLADVSKVFVPAALIVMLINSREKLHWLLAAIAVSVGAWVLRGGYWAAMVGFHERVQGPPGSSYAGNNEFSVLTAIAVPLLVLLYRQLGGRYARWLVAAMIAGAYASAMSSWSRGGMLSLLAASVAMIVLGRQKWFALPLAMAGLIVAASLMPDAWVARMETMHTYQQEGSAVGRLEIWKLGLDYVRQHPWFGGGFGGWIYLSLPTGTFRDWHSAYVQMAAEHGLPGLAVWLALLLGTMASLLQIALRNDAPDMRWAAECARFLVSALAAYCVGVAFLGGAYWEIVYLLIAAAMALLSVAHRQQKVSEFFTVFGTPSAHRS